MAGGERREENPREEGGGMDGLVLCNNKKNQQQQEEKTNKNKKETSHGRAKMVGWGTKTRLVNAIYGRGQKGGRTTDYQPVKWTVKRR